MTGGGPIFFYAGNEDDVTLYVNATGLMWEHAAEFGALLVFAEHRYYGESLPFGAASFQMPHLRYLSHEQALADYAVVLREVKASVGADPESPVVVFGGSYGGMLAAWMRMKSPSEVVGAIAASAPILAFDGLSPAFDGEAYWRVVTRDATAAGGAADACAENVKRAFEVLFEWGLSNRTRLGEVFQTCRPLASDADVEKLALLCLFAWDTLAMGNYPYASTSSRTAA